MEGPLMREAAVPFAPPDVYKGPKRVTLAVWSLSRYPVSDIPHRCRLPLAPARRGDAARVERRCNLAE